MTKADVTKTAFAAVLFGAATLFFLRFYRAGHADSDQAFFYDLSEQKLFLAPRASIPPIKGINDATDDGMRAVVISTNGSPSDKSSWKVAYLEKYSPELKAQMETARTTGGSPQIGRAEALAHRFVRRLTDDHWFSMDSAEAERIVTDWAVPNPQGITPIICTP